MGIIDLEIAKTVAILIGPLIAFSNLCIVLYGKFKNRPKLIFKIERATILEDYPGEIAMQIDISFRGYNGSFFLSNLEIKNRKSLVNKNCKIDMQVREYLSDDIIEEYLESEKLGSTIKKREERKLDQFTYSTQLDLGNCDFRIVDGNPLPPVTKSIFHQSLYMLMRKQIYHENRYIHRVQEINSVRDLRIDNNARLSLTLFVNIYGSLNRDENIREILPLDGWKIFVRHSEGVFKKSIKFKKIPYSRVKEIIN